MAEDLLKINIFMAQGVPLNTLFIINLKLTTMIFFFTSTRKSDKVSQITIVSTDIVRAHVVANRYFKRAGYKGQPKMLAV